MALSTISRTYLGYIAAQSGARLRVASVPSSCLGNRGFSQASTRLYATASASVNKKTPVTAKGVRKDVHNKPPPTAPKPAASTTATKPVFAETVKLNQAAKAEAQSPAAVEHATKEDPATMTDEEKLKEVERMIATSHLIPTIDLWGQEFQDTLDVVIPQKVEWKSSPQNLYRQLQHNLSNNLKNWTALSTLASQNAIPEAYLPFKSSFLERMNRRWQAVQTQSTKPDHLLAPFRELALETYQHMNTAVANRAEKDVKKYTTFEYKKQALGLTKTSKNKHPHGRFIWQLHREIEPTRVLSIRLTEGYLAQDEPRHGNRFIVHALVKFDTEQSLEIYGPRGQPLHLPAEEGQQRGKDGRIPAKRRRVTEYLVLEKKMWQVGPWQFREQVWPSSA